MSGGGLGAERKKLQLVLKTTVSSAHGATSPRTGSHPGPFTAGEKPDSYRRNYVHYVRSFVVSGKGGDGEDGDGEDGEDADGVTAAGGVEDDASNQQLL